MAGSVTVNADLLISRESIQAQAQKIKTAFSSINASVNLNSRGLSQFASSAQKTTLATQSLGNAVQKTSKSAGGLNSSFNNFSRGSAKNFNNALGNINGNASEFQKSMDAATARVFAFGATAIVLNSIAQSFSAVTRSTIEVEKSLIEINSIFGATRSEFSLFREEIFAVAKNTGQSFQTVAEGAAELARQGLSAAETAERLNAALILTRVSGLDSVSSVNALTAALNGFTSAGLTADQVVNKIIAVDTAFAVSAKDLAEGFERAGSTAEDARVSFDELLALITAAQQRTSRGGAVIGNAFKTIFTRTQRSTTIQQLQELGVAINSSQGGVEKLVAISDALERISDPEISAKIKELVGGVFQINIASAALKDLSSETSIFAGALKESAGATDEAFQKNEELNKSLSSQLNSLVVSLTNVSEKIGQITLAPLISDVVQFSESLTETLSKSLSSESGLNLIKGFFQSIGNFVSGPGLVIIAGSFIRIFSRISKFAVESLKDLARISSSAQKTANIEASINNLLSSQIQRRKTILNQNASLATKQLVIKGIIDKENNAILLQNKLRAESLKLAQSLGYVGYDAQGGFQKKLGIGGQIKQGAKDPLIRSLAVGGALSIAAVGIQEIGEKSNDAAKEAESLSSKIERLKKESSKINAELEPDKAAKYREELKQLNQEYQRAESESKKFSDQISKYVNILNSLSLIAAIAPRYGIPAIGGTVGFAAGTEVFTKGEDIRSSNFNASSVSNFEDVFKGVRFSDFFELPDFLKKVEDSAFKFQDGARKLVNDVGAFFTGGLSSGEIEAALNSSKEASEKLGLSGNRLASSTERFLTASNNLTQATRFLSQTVLTGGGKSFSELGARSRTQRGFDESSFFGASSQLLLSQKLASINGEISGSGERQKTLLSSLEAKSVQNELTAILETAAIKAQETLNKEAQQLGFASTSNIASGGKESSSLLSNALSLLNENEKLRTIAFKNFSLNNGRAFTSNEPSKNLETGRALIKAFSTASKTDPSAKALVEIGKRVVSLGEGQELLNKTIGIGREFSLIKASIEKIGGSATRESAFEEFKRLEQSIDKLIFSGALDSEKTREAILSSVERYAEIQREFLVEKAQSDVDALVARSKADNEFIDRLKSTLDQNISTVQNLRQGSLSRGVSQKDIVDPFSKSLNEIFKTLELDATQRSNLITSTGKTGFSKNLINATSSNFRNTSTNLGPSFQVIPEVLQKAIDDAALNFDPTKSFGGIGGIGSGRSVIEPLKIILDEIKSATTIGGLESATEKFRNLFNQISPNSGFDENVINKGSIDVAQLIKTIEAIISSGSIGTAESNVKDKDLSRQEEINRIQEGVTTSLSNLNETIQIVDTNFSEVGSVISKMVSESTATISKTLPDFSSAMAAEATRLSEAAKNLSSNYESISEEISQKLAGIAGGLGTSAELIQTNGGNLTGGLARLSEEMEASLAKFKVVFEEKLAEIRNAGTIGGPTG